ncbi:MAG: hypothetical protein SV377_01675 [Halobacteria archaeon]|nr:hypothetical protein [Halobacteria archaeon]
MDLIRRIKSILAPNITRFKFFECSGCGHMFELELDGIEGDVYCPECRSHDVEEVEYNTISGRWVG